MSQFKPIGWPTVMPRIVTSDVAGLTGFLRTVFGAEGELRSGAPTEIRIGDSIILISDGGDVRDSMPAYLYVYVANADEIYQRAIAAGAEAIETRGYAVWRQTSDSPGLLDKCLADSDLPPELRLARFVGTPSSCLLWVTSGH